MAKWSQPKGSIRGHLVWLLTLILGGILLLGAIGLQQVLRNRLNQRYDQNVKHRAQAFITLTRIVDGIVELEFADEFMPGFSQPEGPEYFQIWFASGAMLERSNSLVDRELPRLPMTSSTQFQDVLLHPGGRCRLVQITYIPEDETRDLDGIISNDFQNPQLMVLAYAQNREDLDQFINQMNWIIGIVFATLLLVTLFLVRKVLDLGLQPLVALRDQVSKMGPETLDAALGSSSEPQEIQPVVQQLNQMLARLKQAIERERAFTANVAHELRTPLAELRSLADVGLLSENDPEETRIFYSEIRAISLEMEQLVSNLLALARCDAGTQNVSIQPLDLIPVLHKCLDRLASTAESEGMQVKQDWIEHAPITGDEGLIEQILQNVIGNALIHGTNQSPVHISVKPEGKGFRLTVTNAAPLLEPGDLTHLMDRFWQKDAARTGGQHSGLGMSLVKSYADLMALKLETRLVDGAFEVQILFPQSNNTREPVNNKA
ncbi:MAG: HAMP domain-containing histidine kinase [Acidobacteria bacterium]|nr:HAMP domain-containing histidine kinase [Acidobacteriota bacterium]